MKPGKSTDHDKDLEQIEQQYRALEQDQPPAMLDQVILNKARLGAETHSIRPWSFGWMHASATAAVLVIGLTLVLQQRSDVPVPPAELDGNAPATIDVELQYSESSLPEEQETAHSELADEALSSETRDLDYRGIDDRPGDESTLDALRANEAKQSGPSRRERAVDSPQRALPEQESQRQKAGERPDPSASASGLNVAVPATALEPVSAPVLQKPEKDIARKISTDEVGFTADAMVLKDPDEWIAKILKMKSDESGDDWRRELETFVAAYPDFVLPDSLKDALSEDPEPGGE
jgi:hypothetical protein